MSLYGPRSDAPPKGTRCAECKERPGVIKWGTDLEAIHGMYSWRCEVCALLAQVAHARERAAALPDLEARLAAAERAAGVS